MGPGTSQVKLGWIWVGLENGNRAGLCRTLDVRVQVVEALHAVEMTLGSLNGDEDGSGAAEWGTQGEWGKG